MRRAITVEYCSQDKFVANVSFEVSETMGQTTAHIVEKSIVNIETPEMNNISETVSLAISVN